MLSVKIWLMGQDLLFALWFFAPAGIANVTPILAAKTPGLKRLDAPVDAGLSWRRRRLLDDHKTWRGIITGVIAGILVLWLQTYLYDNYAWARDISRPVNYRTLSVISFGFLLSFGALFGDLVKSFLKRQIGVPPGNSWFPFDQLDYIIGGLVFSGLY